MKLFTRPAPDFQNSHHWCEKLPGRITSSIVERCKAPLEREFYICMTQKYGKEYFSDLLIFHRRIQCLVAIELKIGEFQPEFVGKMQFYLAPLYRLIRKKGENTSIGIILSKEKNRTIVKYALHDARKPIGVATYRIVKQLPKEFKGQLPPPQEIA